MIRVPRLALALIFVASVCNCLRADQLQDNLEAATKKHEQTVKSAKEALQKAFLTRVKDAAQKEDLDAIKTLIAEKEAFEFDETLPTHPLLTEDVIRYIGARRSSASATYLVYQNSIQSYATKSQLDAAKKLESEAKRFMDEESAAVSLTKLAKPKPDEPDLDKPLEDKGNNTTKDRMADFFSEYGKMLTEIGNQSTTVKQDEVHRNFVKKLDDRMKGQTWELHCRIEDIQPASNGRYTIRHDLPEEFPTPDQRWTCRRSAVVALSQQQAVSLKPGDYVIYTGTPRFVSTQPSLGFGIQTSGDTDYFSVYQEVGGRHFGHTLHMMNAKVKYQKDAEAKEPNKAALPKGRKGK